MFSELFIRRPVLATVCSLIILIAGAIAIPTLPIARYPDLTPPAVSVNAFYTGANAQAVESAVTTPLEQAINGVEGMMNIRSSSTNSGLSSITVTFEIGRNPDLAAVDVQNRVNQALGRMPTEVRTNGISVTKSTAGFLAAIGFFATDNRYDSLFISNYLDLYVRDVFRRIPGVGNVQIFGERKFAMRLWLDPTKLAARNLTAGDVTAALREQNLQVAAGSIGDAPSASDQMYQLSVRAEGRLTDVSQFERIIIKASSEGAIVRMSDIGRVELGAESYSSALRFGGMEASGVGIQLLPEANALDVFAAVQTELERLKASFPPGLQAQIAFDNVVVVRESIIEVLKTLGEAIFLVVLVMFLFLQNWRSTLIPTITIPVSLIGTFAFVKLFDFSINTLTLFGIVLATGIVVDDAIVVIENIERHMREEKKNAHDAAVDAMREVFSAVIVIGLVLVAVFVPVAFFPGTTGRMYQQFSLTIAFAVVLSVFNAVTFTPALSALLLDKQEHAPGRFFRAVNWVIDGGTRAYARAVRVAIGWPVTMLLLFGGVLLLTWGLFRVVPTSFVPDEDEGYFIAIIQAPAGASLEYTSNIARQAEAIVLKQPEVAAAFSVVGFSFSGAAPNQGLMFARLKGFDERTRADQSLSAVLGRMRGQLMSLPGAIIFPTAPPAIQGLSTFGGFQFELLDQSGGDIANLASNTQQLIGAATKAGKVSGLLSTFTANDPQLVISLDRDRARSLGIPIGQITEALQVLLGSQYVNDFDFNNRAYRVYVQGDREFRRAPQNINAFYVRSNTGTMVPLGSVVRLSERTGPTVISHFNLFRATEINGAGAPGVSSGQAIAEMERVAAEVLPPGFTYEWAGQALEEIKAGSQAVYLFTLAILLVYLVLAAQYESWVVPFIILLGVPLAVLGGLSAQWVRGLSNDVFCQIGLVMLIGLAAKNSILIVEFAEQLREHGKSIKEAAIEAARIRLRPILMTSFAFILGVLPLAYATGAGSAARNSVGTAVAGGMLLSTFLSIFFIPVLYVIIRSMVPGKGTRGHHGEHAAAPLAVIVVAALGLGAVPAFAQTPAVPAQTTPGQTTSAQVASQQATRIEFDEAIRLALERNPSVASVQQSVTRAEALLQSARASVMPTLGAGISNLTLNSERSSGAFVTQPQNQTTFGATAAVPILAFPARASVRQAGDQITVAQRAVDDARQQIAVATAQTYLQVVALRRLVDVDVQALEAARAHLDYAQRRLEGGAGSRLNQLRAAQEVSRDEARLEASRLVRARAQEALGVLMVHEGPVEAGADPPLDAPASTDEAVWMPTRTDVRLQSEVRRAVERALSDSRYDWYPSAGVGFTPSIIAPKSDVQDRASWQVAISFTQPIFDGGARSAAKALRSVDVRQAELALTSIQIQARSEARIAALAIASFERALASARLSSEQAAEVLRIATAAFEVGATTNLEVIDAQRQARDAEVAVTQAEDAVRRARLELLVAIGRFPR